MKLQGRRSLMLMKILGSAGVAIVLGVVTVGILTGGGTARATTADEAGLPEPPKAMELKYAYPMMGRFFLTSVGRTAHIMSGQLDMAIQWGEPEWVYGELELHPYASHGTTTSVVSLWYFEYAKGRVSARIVAKGSVSKTHLEGITIGRISFAFPRNGTARVGHNQEPKELRKLTGKLTLNGKAVEVGFTRGSDDKAPPSSLPKAKQIGRG
jgi:hypothetical protein